MTGTAASAGLSDQIAHFGRLLRAAGLPVGTDRILTGVRAAAAVGLVRRDDLFAALQSALTSRPEQHEVFARAFDAFFRERGGMEDALASLLPRVERPDRGRRPGSRRAGAGWNRSSREAPARSDSDAEPEIVASESDREALRHRDFAQMTAEETRRAESLVARLRLPLAAVPSRRLRPDLRGERIDPRASLRASLRTLAADMPLRRRAPAQRPSPLVLLCDVSGSMSRYSRMLLHFSHVVMATWPRVHVFVFGTRLTNVTRAMRGRDVDAALARVGTEAPDWSGGTRIGASLRDFNRRWSRRVLATGATVLLVTDGLDREDGRGLARLQRSCRRLVWLNPLLRYEGFEPRASGIRALLPHVDDFRPCHDLTSLEALVQALGDGPAMRAARP